MRLQSTGVRPTAELVNHGRLDLYLSVINCAQAVTDLWRECCRSGGWSFAATNSPPREVLIRASVARVWTDEDRAECFRRVTAVAAALPDAQVAAWGQHLRLSLGRKGFGRILADHHQDGRLALTCKAPPGEQQALVAQDPGRYFVPPYDGVHGWVGAYLDPEHHPNWAEIDALIAQAWRLVAPATMVRQFDAATVGSG